MPAAAGMTTEPLAAFYELLKQEPRLRLRLVLPGRKCRWIDLFDASSRPVTVGPIVPCAISSSLSLSEKLLVVDPRRASPLDNNFSIDDHCLDVRATAVLDQRVDGIAYGSVACGSEIDDDDVCFGSRRKASQIVATEGGCSANCCGIKQIGGTSSGCVLVDEARNQGAVTHFGNDIQWICVGS